MLTSADVCCRYLSGDYEGAQSALADAIAMDPSHSSGHMLMAKILIELGRFREANASLEQALSLSRAVQKYKYRDLYWYKSTNTDS
jgi:Tfp pilus assembly protein PilF